MVNIVVCIKMVPRPEEVVVEEKTKTVDRAKARSVLNPPDLNAIEASLAIRDKHGGKVTLISMGPPFAEKFMKYGLAMGADDAILLSDRAFAGADTLATSYVLAKAVSKIGDIDIIVCGEESSDGATGQVPPGIAEWLQINQMTYAKSVDMVPARKVLIGVRDNGRGEESVEVPLPAVVAVESGINDPRFMDFDVKQRYEGVKIKVWTAADIGADPARIGFTGSPTSVGAVKVLKGKERKKEKISGTPEEQAKQVWERIKPVVR
jgi:electron transfer flavoprotein beta subunit